MKQISKSFNRVDLIVFCKYSNRVHTSLYVCKSSNKVDLVVLYAPNRADHQKWSIVSLNRPTFCYSSKVLWVPSPPQFYFLFGRFLGHQISVLFCYECFIFQVIMHAVVKMVYDNGLHNSVKKSFNY